MRLGEMSLTVAALCQRRFAISKTIARMSVPFSGYMRSNSSLGHVNPGRRPSVVTRVVSMITQRVHGSESADQDSFSKEGSDTTKDHDLVPMQSPGSWSILPRTSSGHTHASSAGNGSSPLSARNRTWTRGDSSGPDDSQTSQYPPPVHAHARRIAGSPERPSPLGPNIAQQNGHAGQQAIPTVPQRVRLAPVYAPGMETLPTSQLWRDRRKDPVSQQQQAGLGEARKQGNPVAEGMSVEPNKRVLCPSCSSSNDGSMECQSAGLLRPNLTGSEESQSLAHVVKPSEDPLGRSSCILSTGAVAEGVQARGTGATVDSRDSSNVFWKLASLRLLKSNQSLRGWSVDTSTMDRNTGQGVGWGQLLRFSRSVSTWLAKTRAKQSGSIPLEVARGQESSPPLPPTPDRSEYPVVNTKSYDTKNSENTNAPGPAQEPEKESTIMQDLITQHRLSLKVTIFAPAVADRILPEGNCP